MKPLQLVTPGGAKLVIRRRTLVGRGVEAKLFVDAAGVAASHAWLEPHGPDWSIRPERGAVYVNGTRASERAELRPGDRLAIGEAVLRIGGQAASLRVERKRLAVLAAVGFALAVLLTICARPAASAGATPVLQLEANGDRVRWEGESGELVLQLALADPARALVELEIQTPERREPLELRVNDGPSSRVEAASIRKLALRRDLRQGVNRISLRGGAGLPLRQLSASIKTTPIPDCSAAPCEATLRSSLARAERLARERHVAPENLFEAWRWLRRARGYAMGAGDEGSIALVETRLEEVEAALEERCAGLRFMAARHIALDDLGGAGSAARELLAAFPGDEHGCHASGQELLQILDEGGGR